MICSSTFVFIYMVFTALLILLFCCRRKYHGHNNIVIITDSLVSYDSLKTLFDGLACENYHHGIWISSGPVGDKKLIIALSGQSMVNTSRTVQYIIDRYGSHQIENIISVGEGIFFQKKCKPSIIIPKYWYHHAIQLWQTQCTEVPDNFDQPYIKNGYTSVSTEKGINCGKDNRWILFNQTVKEDKKSKFTFRYYVDPKLFNKARSICNDNKNIHVGGAGATGNVLLYDKKYMEYLQCIQKCTIISDSVGQAIAQVASFYKIPFLVIKYTSNHDTSELNKVVSLLIK